MAKDDLDHSAGRVHHVLFPQHFGKAHAKVLGK